jgi:uncharacterized protein YbjT (DUF2867 family)
MMSKKVLVLGATGHIAHFAIEALLDQTDDQLVLFTRHPQHLPKYDQSRVTVVQGDTLKAADLDSAMNGVDMVYANLANPEIKTQAENIVAAMDKHNITTLVWISTLGIYNEVPGKFGQWNNDMLGFGKADGYLTTYRAAADVIENSDLNYTIIRPAWLTNKDEVDYETTDKGQDFKGTEVSRKSIGNFVATILQDPTQYAKRSIGVNRPHTDGDKPAWY